MIQIKDSQITSTEGRLIRRIGSEFTFSAAIALPSDTPEDFEEVSELPPYTPQEYREEVQRLIARRYSLADEIAIERQREQKPEQWQEHFDYCEQCKAEAKTLLSQKE